MRQKTCGLRVDIDTKRGNCSGVPAILRILAQRDVKASFFITTGPDDFIFSLNRIYREKGFLSKLFSLRESYFHLVSTDLFCNRKKTIELILSEGHEVGVHGYSHFKWIALFRPELSELFFEYLKKSMQEFFKFADYYPSFSGAPGWKTSEGLLLLQDSINFDWASDVRSRSPFTPVSYRANSIKTIQIPVTLPTLDEILISKNPLKEVFDNGDIYCAHAELEGIKYKYFLERILDKNKEKGVIFKPLSYFKKRGSKAYRKVKYGFLPGRTNPVALA
ncbi:polysaccharide deacetylase family protein [candidate division WOR-3 bacterium]|nr:polysaccharide deacetylase family protein [candidate division WOR-3 bacterium]